MAASGQTGADRADAGALKRRRRPDRLIRLAAVAAILALAGRYAYSRIAQRPPGPAPAAETQPARTSAGRPDTTALIKQALARLSARQWDRTIPELAQGRTFLLETEADKRKHEAILSAFLGDPEVRIAIAELERACDGSLTEDLSRAGAVYPNPLQRGVGCFIVRAHRRWRVERDPMGALADLKTGYKLCRMLHEQHTIPALEGAAECEKLVTRYMLRFSSDPTVNVEIATAAIAVLLEVDLPPRPDFARLVNRLVRKCRDRIDDCYIRNAGGNGWLDVAASGVLDSLAGSPAASTAGGERSRCWNLLSPLFHSRKQVEARLARFLELFGEADRLTGAAALHAMSRVDRYCATIDNLDWPLNDVLRFPHRAYRVSLYAATAREAALAAFGARIHFLRHGRWPDRLADLVPDPLPRLPQDRFRRVPLQYLRRHGVLYLFCGLQTPPGADAVPGVVHAATVPWEGKHIWRFRSPGG